MSNFIGTSDMRVDIGSGTRLNPRDTVLLLSDGLTDNVHIHEISDLIRKGAMAVAVRSITGLARRRMTVETLQQPSKADDISVILFRRPYAQPGRPKGSDG